MKIKVLFLLALLVTLPGSQAASVEPTKPPPSRNFANLPLSFEVNKGQANSRAKFISRGRGYTFLLTEDGADLSLQNTAVTMKLVNARHAHMTGLDELPGKSNYFIGNDPAEWHVNIPTYARVKYDDVYPGIDLVYYGNQQQLEYDFLVSPGADPRAISLELKTETSKRAVRIDANGDLVIHTSSGNVRWLKPVVYQPSSTAARQPVSARFVLLAKNRVGFKLGTYDRTRPLVIDPVLSYSTYLGGSASEIATDIAVDSQGNAYVSGPTCTGFSNGPECNAIITKINSTGTAVVYSSVFGGDGDDRAHSIALDALGQAYVTGSTCSSDFPTTSGAFQTALAGRCDAFVSKIDVNGGKLYSTYLGGAENPAQASGDEGLGIAVDSSGNAYVAGVTCTDNFPTKNGFRSNQDHCDGFAVKLNPAGGGSSDLLYSTLLGGDDGVEDASSIAVDSSNNVYVAGITTGNDFPTTDGAFQTSKRRLQRCLGSQARYDKVRLEFVSLRNLSGRPPRRGCIFVAVNRGGFGRPYLSKWNYGFLELSHHRGRISTHAASRYR
jgi:Beta-propeller repeat